jgi:hypothetical protein
VLARRHHTPWSELDHHQATFSTSTTTALPPQTSAKAFLLSTHKSARFTRIVREGTRSPRCPTKSLSDSPLAPSDNLPPTYNNVQLIETRRNYHNYVWLGSGLVWRWAGKEGGAQESHTATTRTAGDVEQTRKAPTEPNGRARYHSAKIRLIQQER